MSLIGFSLFDGLLERCGIRQLLHELRRRVDSRSRKFRGVSDQQVATGVCLLKSLMQGRNERLVTCMRVSGGQHYDVQKVIRTVK